jgi:hypothetical protein
MAGFLVTLASDSAMASIENSLRNLIFPVWLVVACGLLLLAFILKSARS